MVKKTKAKKYRGIGRTHGRGSKAGRGKGLKGGSGNAGLHKHRFATTVILQKQGIFHFGRHGFKRHGPDAQAEGAVLNVRDLTDLAKGQGKLDLGAMGYGKLLGGGSLSAKVEVTVPTASESAVKKVEAAGGRVVQTQKDASKADA